MIVQGLLRVGLVGTVACLAAVPAAAQQTVVLEGEFDDFWLNFDVILSSAAPGDAPIATVQPEQHVFEVDQLICEIGDQVTVRGDRATYKEPPFEICSDTMIFEIKLRDVFVVVAFNDVVPLMEFALQDDRLRPFAESLAVAIDAGDQATIALAATQLHGLLATTALDLTPLRSLSIDYTSQSLTQEWLILFDEELDKNSLVIFDISTGRLEYSTTGVDTLRSYQSTVGIPMTGSADWPTLSTMSDRSWSDLSRGLPDVVIGP